MMRASALLAAGAALCAAGAAHAERLLVRGAEVSVYEAAPAPCGQPVDLRAQATDARVFQGDLRVLGSAVDAARAMLLFECRSLGDLRVSGRLASDPAAEVFGATARAADGWRLAGGTAAASGAAVRAGTTALDDRRPPSAFTVSDLAIGMPLAEVRRIAGREIGNSGTYDDREQTLEAVDGGCDFDFSEGPPKPGWRCLQVAFAGDAAPTLARLVLSQAVDLDQAALVREKLVERYGPPAVSLQPTRQLLVAGGSRPVPLTLLGWGRAVDGESSRRAPEWPATVRPLEAEILVRDGVTVVILRLTGEVAAAGRPAHRVRF